MQGVFYRASAKAKATELGISGFVRNEENGTVYAEVEGDQESVQQFMAWCRKGPAGADVEVVEPIEGEVRNFRGFLISR